MSLWRGTNAVLENYVHHATLNVTRNCYTVLQRHTARQQRSVRREEFIQDRPIEHLTRLQLRPQEFFCRCFQATNLDGADSVSDTWVHLNGQIDPMSIAIDI